MKTIKPNNTSDLNRPQQYIQGWVEFYKLKFKVTDGVLIPRPETELLVDAVLKYIREVPSNIKPEEILVLDVGTGAGNIAISISKNLPAGRQASPGVKIVAADISTEALHIAELNAKFHGVEDRILFLQSNLLQNPEIPALPGSSPSSKYKVLIVVTNLPYIPSSRIPYLDSSVKDFEPFIALDGGEDGFGLYRKLFADIQNQNIKFNILLGEIDYTHKEIALEESVKYFPQAAADVQTDLAHKQRILTIINP